MVEAHFIPYNDETHRDQFYGLNLEHLTLIDKEAYARHGIKVNPGGTVKEYLDNVFPMFTAIKPPEGIIYILEVDGEAAGMGALKKLEGGVGEIKRMFIRRKYRGLGYGKEMLKRLEEKATEFGFTTLRLDTSDFQPAAVHIYRKAGFKEIGKYSGVEWENRSDTKGIQIYMEKKL